MPKVNPEDRCWSIGIAAMSVTGKELIEHHTLTAMTRRAALSEAASHFHRVLALSPGGALWQSVHVFLEQRSHVVYALTAQLVQS